MCVFPIHWLKLICPVSILQLMERGFASQEMSGQFHFCVERPGVFHGFTAWFAVHFESLEKGGTAVELNTGPDSEYKTVLVCVIK